MVEGRAPAGSPASRPHYDGRAESWREVYASEDPYARRVQRRRDAIVASVQQQASGRKLEILDAGCGTGQVARRLMGLGHSVAGLDYSVDMLGVARLETGREGFPSAYVGGSVLRLPFSGGRFDAAVCAGVLEHMPVRKVGPKRVDAEQLVLAELIRVLRPDGFLVVTASNLARIHWILDPRPMRRALAQRRQARRCGTLSVPEGEEGRIWNWIGTDPTTRRRTPGEIRRDLGRLDLGIAAWRGIGFGPFTLFGRHLLPFGVSVRLSEGLEALAGRSPFGFMNRLAGTLVLTVRPEVGSRGLARAVEGDGRAGR